MTTLKAFSVGLPKCGTTTLHWALRSAGWVSAHWQYNGKPIGKQIYGAFRAGGDPVGPLSGCDAITQGDFIGRGLSLWPQMDAALLKAIQHHHPSCRFLLPVREPARAADSICRWPSLQDRLVRLGAPGLAPGAAAAPGAIEAWIASHYEFCRSLFRDDGRFVEYDIESPEAPEIIGRHLGIEIKWWGVANRGGDAVRERPARPAGLRAEREAARHAAKADRALDRGRTGFDPFVLAKRAWRAARKRVSRAARARGPST